MWPVSYYMPDTWSKDRDDDQWQYQVPTQMQGLLMSGFLRSASLSLDCSIHIFKPANFPQLIKKLVAYFYILGDYWAQTYGIGSSIDEMDLRIVHQNTGHAIAATGRYEVNLESFMHQQIKFQWVIRFRLKNADRSRFVIGLSHAEAIIAMNPDFNPHVPITGVSKFGCHVPVVAKNNDSFVTTLSVCTKYNCMLKAVATFKKVNDDDILAVRTIDYQQIGCRVARNWFISICASEQDGVIRRWKIIKFGKRVSH